MYRCHSCGKTFQKRAKKCPSCNSDGITLVPDPKGASGTCGALVGLAIATAAAAAVLGYMGFITIPGITPGTQAPTIENLKPKEDAPPPKDKKPEKTDSRSNGAQVETIAPKAPSSAPKPEALAPPVDARDLAKAQALYAKGDFAGARKVLDGCDRPEVSTDGATNDARALWRKATILDVLTKKIPLSALATAKKLERVSTSSGRPMIGVVTETDDAITIVVPGGISTEIKKDDLGERSPATRADLVEKLHASLEDRKARLKADDAFGNYRLGNYCWQYALADDAVPFLDKAVTQDDFPTVARVFGGADANAILQTWCDLTGKIVAGVPSRTPKNPGGTATPADTNPPPAPSGNVADVAKRARAKYDEGLVQYRKSYGDTREAHTAHVAALKLFNEARDILNAAGEDPSVEDLRHDINLVLMDCRKRPI